MANDLQILTILIADLFQLLSKSLSTYYIKSMQGKKTKLCKFKENCPNFLSNTNCGFDHVECKFKEKCKDKQTCLFYHKIVQGGQSSVQPKNNKKFTMTKAETPCNFGVKCKNRETCQFKHEQPMQKSETIPQTNQSSSLKPSLSASKINKPCHFGVNCKKANCNYLHDSQQDPRKQLQEMPQQRKQIPPNQSNRRPQGSVFENMCFEFMMNNRCGNGALCPKQHQFTEKGTFQRLYFSTQFPTQKCSSMLFYEKTKQQRQDRTKETLYVLQQNSWIDFKRLTSSEKIYEEIDEIGNQENLFFMRSLKQTACDFGFNIEGIETFSIDAHQYLTFIAGQNIIVYSIETGAIVNFPTEKIGNKVSGVIAIKQRDSHIVLIATTEQLVLQLVFNTRFQKFQRKNVFKIPSVGFKLFKQTSELIFGDRIYLGVTKNNKLAFFNSRMQSKEVSVGDNALIWDADICILNNKVPVCFASASSGTSHQIFAVNLLNFEIESVLNCKTEINKVCVIQGHLLAEIKNKGLVVYKVGQFERQIGIIPLRNEVQTLRKDSNGNLVVLESKNIEFTGSLSIFKIRKG